MNKVITINIAGRAYQVEEQGYDALTTYIAAARESLDGNPDQDEIVSDLEAAIAEKAGGYLSAAKNVLLAAEAAAIIEAMGPIDGAEAAAGNSTPKGHAAKRLYRDTDNAVIAGVASGLASYFNIDPVIMRVIFVAWVFLGGSGILVYIILWLAIPEAATASQKLEMKGSKVTFDAMKEFLGSKVEEVRARNTGGTARKLLEIPLAILRGIGRFVQRFVLPALRIIIGVGLALGAAVAALALTVGLALAIVKVPGLVYGPYAELAQGGIYHIALAGSFIAVFIPIIMICLAGIAIVRKGRAMSRAVFGSFAIIWGAAVVALTVAGFLLFDRGDAIMRANPTTVATAMYVPAPFGTIRVQNGIDVQYVQSKDYGASATGSPQDIDHLSIETIDGVLIVKRAPLPGVCLFCPSQSLAVTISSPTLTDITLENGSTFEGDIAGKGTLAITARNASRVQGTMRVGTLDLRLHNNSRAIIAGNADASTIMLENASFYDGGTINTVSTDITAKNGSRALVYATGTLTVHAENGSHITYSGSPAVTETLRNGSRLEKQTESED